MDMNVLMKTVEKITLTEPITLEQLYELMMKNNDKIPEKFKLKKGLMGKSILFDVFMQTQPCLTVKDNTVTVRRMGNKTEVGIGDMPSLDFKAIKQGLGAVKEGGLSKSISGGAEYFVRICDIMNEILKDKKE